MKIICDNCGELPLPPMVREDKIIRLDSLRSPLTFRCKRCQAGLYLDMNGETFTEKWWTDEDLYKYIVVCMRDRDYADGRGNGAFLKKLLTEVFDRHVIE